MACTTKAETQPTAKTNNACHRALQQVQRNSLVVRVVSGVSLRLPDVVAKNFRSFVMLIYICSLALTARQDFHAALGSKSEREVTSTGVHWSGGRNLPDPGMVVGSFLCWLSKITDLSIFLICDLRIWAASHLSFYLSQDAF